MQRGAAGKKRGPARKIYEALYCLILLANLLLVFFDATYLLRIPYTHYTFRDVYLKYAPRELHYRYTAADYSAQPELRIAGVVYDPLRLFYDPIKGIERHRATDAYLAAYEALREQLAANPSEELAPETLALLAQLSEQSVGMINDDPFVTANKRGTFELIKNRMRKHAGEESAKDAFRKFFSAENLTPERRKAELAFFDQRILPMFQQNYFRWIGVDGEPKDFFNKFDLWFVGFFWIDFLVRWIAAIRRREHRKWYLFAVRHWYEVFLLFPPDHFAFFRLLRVIPFLYRLRENNFIPDSGLAPEIIHENAGVIAEEISGMVLVNILAQLQTIIKQRGLRELVTLNEEGALDELQDLLESQAEMISSRVVPEIQPQIVDLVQHSVRAAMSRWLASPVGPAMRLAIENVNTHIEKGLHSALAEEEGVKRLSAITKTFVHAMLQEASRDENVRVLEQQLYKLLDGVQSQVRIAITRR